MFLVSGDLHMYDNNNIFAKIITGSLPTEKVHEDDHVIAIKDINPVAPVHLLIIPKGKYTDFSDFTAKASNDEIAKYFQAIAKVAADHELEDYRLISNKGSAAGQSVFHFHTHLIGGTTIEGLIDKGL